MERDAGHSAFTYGIRAGRSLHRLQRKQEVSATFAGYQIAKRGRFWEVRDADGGLVCLTAYKKGAFEVVRRLSDPGGY